MRKGIVNTSITRKMDLISAQGITSQHLKTAHREMLPNIQSSSLGVHTLNYFFFFCKSRMRGTDNQLCNKVDIQHDTKLLQ